MSKTLEKLSVFFSPLLLTLVGSSSAFAEGAPGQVKSFFQDVPPQSMMAGSPITDYTVHVMIYMLVIGVLLTGLLGGAFAVINVGMLSKREEDVTGKSDPSDVEVFARATERSFLPAEEEKETINRVIDLETRRDDAQSVKRLREEDMYKADTKKAA